MSRHTQSKKLLITIILTFSFMLAEYGAGLLFKSLSLISDAAHMMTDVSALIISWVAIKLIKIPANSKKTFGYYRFEILAASFNTSLLFIVGIYILFEAILRIKHPVIINSSGMLVISTLGLIINLLSLKMLHSHKDDNLNFKSAYLEVFNDMLSSLGVIVGAILVYFTHIAAFDTLIAILISLWIFPRTWLILKESINILLEAVPQHINYHEVKKDLVGFEGILGVHDLHIWALSSQQINLTAHLHIEQPNNNIQLLNNLKTLLKNKYNISHTTFQIESNVCDDNPCH